MDTKTRKKDLSRGIALFHALFPPPELEKNKEIRQFDAPKVTKNDQKTQKSEVKLPKMRSEPVISMIQERKGIEQDLDALIPRPKRMKMIRISANTSKTAQKSPEIPSFSPSKPAIFRPETGKLKSLRGIRKAALSPVYLTLPPLPFGTHHSYNDIPSLRSMLLTPLSPLHSDSCDSSTDNDIVRKEGVAPGH